MDSSNCLNMQIKGEMFDCPSLSDSAETMASLNFQDIIHQPQFQDLDKRSAIAFLSSRDQKVAFYVKNRIAKRMFKMTTCCY